MIWVSFSRQSHFTTISLTSSRQATETFCSLGFACQATYSPASLLAFYSYSCSDIFIIIFSSNILSNIREEIWTMSRFIVNSAFVILSFCCESVFMWLLLFVVRTTHSTATTSGLRRAVLETSVMLESSTASLNHWWVRISALTLLNPAAPK